MQWLLAILLIVVVGAFCLPLVLTFLPSKTLGNLENKIGKKSDDEVNKPRADS